MMELGRFCSMCLDPTPKPVWYFDSALNEVGVPLCIKCQSQLRKFKASEKFFNKVWKERGTRK